MIPSERTKFANEGFNAIIYNLHKVGWKKNMHEKDTCYRDNIGVMR
jgi:hypothetical protein